MSQLILNEGAAAATPAAGKVTVYAKTDGRIYFKDDAGTEYSASISLPVAAADGGTGITSYAVGDIVYASATTTLSKLAGVATGNVLISGGVTTAPAWGKVGLTTHVSGILGSGNGGTGNGFTKFSGPTTAEKTFTLPDSSDTVSCLAQAQSFTKAQRGAFVELTDAATIALDLSLANQYRVTLGGNRTLGVPTNIAEGQQGVISIRQDATGSRTLAYAWPYEWAGGTAGVLSTAGCSRDQLVYSVEKYATATVTITIATPGVVSWVGHGLENGQRVRLSTTGALPTGLAAGTTYFVAGKTTGDFKLATSLANAAAGTYINTSGSQSGTHTMVAASISVALNKAYA